MSLVHKKKLSISIMIPFAILALVFGILVWKKVQDTHTVQPVTPTVSEPVAARTGVLFFISPDGAMLMREGRELDPCGDQNACLADLLEELLSGSVSGLQSAIPESTTLVSSVMDGNTVTINLNSLFAQDLPSGSSAEMLAVYSIVNTVALNFPHVEDVKLTVDGNPKSILRHLDLSEPLQPDFSLEKGNQSQPAAHPESTKKTKGMP